MSYLGPNRFPFMQKPADFDADDELKGGVPQRFDFSLVCALDQLEAEGFGRTDIDRLVAWKRGLVEITDAEELLRMGRLALLVVVNGDTVR